MTLATASRTTERQGAVTFKGNPLTLIGPEIKVGDQAPDCQVLRQDLTPAKLSETAGKVRLISVVPSLDTPVCDQQTRRFNEEAAKLPANVVLWTVSMDLPFAQKRWCGAAGIDRAGECRGLQAGIDCKNSGDQGRQGRADQFASSAT